VTDPAVLPPGPTQRRDPIPVIAANATAIVGMIALHWSPQSVLALYAIDTALALCAMGWLVMEHVTEKHAKSAGIARAAKHVVAALLIGALLSLVLVAPVLFVFAGGDWARSQPWRDPAFQGAVALQVVGSLVALVRTHLMLAAQRDGEPWLAQEFRFLVARWGTVLMLVFFGIASYLGDLVGSFVLVIAYAGASVWYTLFPEKAEAIFSPRKGKDAAQPPPARG
jgi:hypothetical protein